VAPTQPREWLSPSETARMLGVSVSRVRQLTTVENKLRYVSTPLGKLIDARDAQRLATERAERANG
jgi:hypothetical protein